MGSLYQTESFVTACISLVRSQTNRDGANSRRVRNHEKKNQEMLFADWAQYYEAFFVPGQEPAFAWPSGNGPVRVSSLKPFVAPFLPTRATAPGSPRMSSPRMTEQALFF